MRPRLALTAVLLLSLRAVATAREAVDPRSLLEGVAAAIEESYFDPEVARRIAAELRAEAAAGRFDAIQDPRELAGALTDRLRPEDAHFGVLWIPPDPEPQVEASSAPQPRHDPEAPARENHGFRRVEVLPGNIGLVELTLFSHFEGDEEIAGSARAVADSALALLARARALIVDLRDCRGGSPAMVGYLVGHFVAEGADVYNTFQSGGPDRSERPTVPIAAPRRVDLPLFVLTSGSTGSGAESFAYTLQAAGRAEVVGERTAGAANPGDFHLLGDGFRVFVSSGRPVNPITGGNWEGTGVAPDVEVAAAAAQAAAYELALEAVIAAEPPGPAATEAQWALGAARAAWDASALAAVERRRYVGEYGGRRIEERGGELVYLLDRRPPRRLLALGEDRFTPEGTPFARLEFVRDAAGEIAALVVRFVTGATARYPRSALNDPGTPARASP